MKTVLDTMRVACANVESGPRWRARRASARAIEVKKTLPSLSTAPGRIRVGLRTIAVDVAPAGTDLERAAFATFLDAVKREKDRAPRGRAAAKAEVPITDSMRAMPNSGGRTPPRRHGPQGRSRLSRRPQVDIVSVHEGNLVAIRRNRRAAGASHARGAIG